MRKRKEKLEIPSINKKLFSRLSAIDFYVTSRFHIHDNGLNIVKNDNMMLTLPEGYHNI